MVRDIVEEFDEFGNVGIREVTFLQVSNELWFSTCELGESEVFIQDQFQIVEVTVGELAGGLAKFYDGADCSVCLPMVCQAPCNIEIPKARVQAITQAFNHVSCGARAVILTELDSQINDGQL